jgi:hypothetical protein
MSFKRQFEQILLSVSIFIKSNSYLANIEKDTVRLILYSDEGRDVHRRL